MSWFYLALLAPLIFAIVNLIDDNLLKSMYKGPYVATMISGLFGALPLLSLLFINWQPIGPGNTLRMVVAGFLTTLYYFFYFKALGVESPSVVIALLALIPATLPMLSAVFLNERLSAQQVAGLIILLTASFLMSASFDEFKKPKFSKALPAILTIVALVNVISLLTKQVYNQVDFFPAYMMFTAGVGLGGVYFMLIIGLTKHQHDLSVFQRRLRHIVPVFIAVELIGILAEYVSNLAVSRGPVSLVRVIEGVQPMYVLLIALALAPFWPRHFREAFEGRITFKFFLILVTIGGLALVQSAG